MFVTITYLKLNSPLKFFALSLNGLKIVRQLKETKCAKVKNTGFWKDHYTMTLWPTMEDLKAFAKSGAHLEAMKQSAELATEIRTLTYETNDLPGWKEAKAMIGKEGKVIRF